MAKVLISGRIDTHIKSTVEYICDNSKLNKSDFLEFACIEFIIKWDKSLKYEGIDFKEYAQLVKFSRLRRIVGKKRNEFLSKNLMIGRINIDIMKIVLQKRKLKREDLQKLIFHYLSLRKQEAKYYGDNKDLFKEIKELEEKLSKNKISEFRKYLQDKVSDTQYIQEMSKNE